MYFNPHSPSRNREYADQRMHPALRPRPAELCHLFTDWTGEVPAAGLLVEEKRDGIRAVYIDGRLYSRKGSEIHGTRHIRKVLAAMEQRAGCTLFIDGEFQIGDSLRDTLSHFARGKKADDAGTLWAFDCMPLDAWQRDACYIPLIERKAALRSLVQATEGGERAAVVVMLNAFAATASDVERMAYDVWRRRGEGLVLKGENSLYCRRRTDAWLKVKQEGRPTRRRIP